jgi:sulfite dehydrogenase (cytochrome) subunit A
MFLKSEESQLQHADPDSVSRRRFLQLASAAALSGVLSSCHSQSSSDSFISVPPGQTVARFPEKAELIMLTDRPPLLETPLYYFREDLTPNEAFFVRWHYEGIPTYVDTRTFRLNVGGHVQKPLSLSLSDLKQQFEPASIVAVNQCSGNSRSLFEPQVPGGQWRNGAMGNARWTGVRMKDLLNRAGVKSGAVDVSLAGLDEAPLFNMHKFMKSLGVEHALSDEVLVAYAMNDKPLPMLNGFPLRLVVPGWYATYWVKSLASIQVLPDKFHGFWMEKAYLVPRNANATESPEHLATDMIPINRMNVRSILVRPDVSDVIRVGTPQEVVGIAFDSGAGISKVEVSLDAGKTWQLAKLDSDSLGKFSFRRFRLAWAPETSGAHKLMSRAYSNDGQHQRFFDQWNKSGYMRNVIEPQEVTVI